MTAPDDIYSLLSWVQEQELKAHNNAAKYPGFVKGVEYSAEEKAFKRVVEKILSMRVNQRPHVRITEEFDGSR